MNAIPERVTRANRTKTAAVLTLAAAVAGGALLLTPRTPRPGRPINTGDSVLVTARASSAYVLRGTSEAHIAVTLDAPDLDAPARPPVALAVVIDCSHSMLGKPLDDAKRAAARLVERLGAGDQLAIVTFSTEAETILTLRPADAAGKQAALDAIAGIVELAGTNISAGLVAGSDALDAAHQQLAGEQLGRIVLIGDGQANAGIYDPRGLADLAARTADRGVSITTVGVGLDFDERTMSAIAVAGRGDYHFVEDTADLGGMFDRELDSLGQTVASEASLIVTPAPGVELLEAYGYRVTPTGDGAYLIPVADLRAREQRKVVLRVRVTATASGPMQLATMTLSWRQRGRGAQVAEATAMAQATDDVALVAGNRDRAAARQIEEAQTAIAIDQATALYERGDVAEAERVMQVRAQAAATTAAELGDDSLRARVDSAVQATQHNFATAPTASGVGAARAAKANRSTAFDLAR